MGEAPLKGRLEPTRQRRWGRRQSKRRKEQHGKLGTRGNLMQSALHQGWGGEAGERVREDRKAELARAGVLPRGTLNGVGWCRPLGACRDLRQRSSQLGRSRAFSVDRGRKPGSPVPAEPQGSRIP